MVSKRKRRLAKRSGEMTILVNKRWVTGRRTKEGHLVTADGKVYVFGRIDSRWHLFADPNKAPKTEMGKLSDLGKFETRGTDTYQYQLVGDDVVLVLVQPEVRVTSLGYVKNAGVKSRHSGS